MALPPGVSPLEVGPALAFAACHLGLASKLSARRPTRAIANRKKTIMCLAIPAKIASLDGEGLATVDILGVTRSISIDLTPQAGVGDFVLVHAGFAIEVVDPDYAQETINLIKEFPEIAGDELPEGALA